MKKILILTICAICTLACIVSCGKIELPTEADENEYPSDEDGDEDEDYDYSDQGTLTVLAALKCPIDTIIYVKGYIVGYIDGTSISKSVFGLPSKANPNMLLASSPDETDYTRCMAVRLPISSSLDLRENLNLFDNPENYKRPIIMQGLVATYFGKNGFYDVYYYEWCDEIDDTPSGEDEDDGEENQEDTGIDTPDIDGNPEIIPDGR